SEAAEGRSNQYAEMSQVTRGIAAGLSERGLKGLIWETIYEIGHTMPMADIHYSAARGIREADPKAKLMGPATWPGWTVEERFVKPFLSKYGPELLDFVTMHSYADNEHGLWNASGWKERKGPITMADGLFLTYLMETTPKYVEWCRSLKKLLNDPKLNPRGKPIGIVFTEFDALAESAYGRNPENVDWPNYREEADCYLNTNHFGGVWCASVLCHLAASGCLDIACKFNTRQFYGLIDNAPDGGFYRQPVWFAWKLLQDVAGMKPGARLVYAEARGPRDKAKEHVGGADTPWVEAFAVRSKGSLRLILINRSLEAQEAAVQITTLRTGNRSSSFIRYVFAQDRVARFIGRKAGTKGEGSFEGAQPDDLSNGCLLPSSELTARKEGNVLRLPDLTCPPISITILVMK
ncbi:MAG: hypothetical protein HY318_02170, partial [Armatimonadetes bacterium]|nr:hypothetical protein [Armatimonadota bacterium]